MLTWWRSAVNFSFFRCLAAWRMRSNACDTRSRFCARCVLCWLAFPSAPPWLRQLRCRLTGFVRWLLSYYGGVRLLTIVHHRLRLLASPTRTISTTYFFLLLADREISRSRTESVRTCQVLRPRRAGRALALACSSVLPSATRRPSAPGMRSLSRLNSLACVLPCQRFTTTLANRRA